MAGGSKPKVKAVDVRTDEQKALSKVLAGIIPARLASATPPSAEMIDTTLMGSSWTEGVVGPMMRAFQTYVSPQITQAFRRGGLFSQARGTAISRALEGLQGTLAGELANRNWAATLAKASMLERPYYESSAAMKEALGFMQTPGKQVAGVQGSGGSGLEGLAAMGLGSYMGGGGTFGGLLGGGAAAAGTAGAAAGTGAAVGSTAALAASPELATWLSTKAFVMCIPEGSLIDTLDGQVKVEDVRAGHYVLDKDFKSVRVLCKYEFDETPSENRFLLLEFEDDSKVVVCDMHKLNGIRAKDLIVGEDGLVSKSPVAMNVRSYDLLTTGRDGGYMVNGVGVDSMIPELHVSIKEN